MTFLRFFQNFEFFSRNSSCDIARVLARPVSSTSLPGGNQVDGLPPASSTETIAKLVRLGAAENDTTSTENYRVDRVLVGDLQENPQKTSSSVYERLTSM